MSKVRTRPAEGEAEGIRIGELSRRAGIPTATLRAWERRYGLPSPPRGESGYRLYGEEDELALLRMKALIGEGLAPAQAARRARAETLAAGPSPAPLEAPIDGLRDELAAALAAFDDRRADALLDRAVAVLSTEALLEEVLLPVLRDLERNTVGQEHFASNLIRGRLLALARGWGGGEGRRALLACPSGEFHDIGLIAFGLALREHGWRIAFLGGDTPVDTLRAAADAMRPEAVVLFSIHAEPFEDAEGDLAALAGEYRLILSGPGAGAELCERIGAARLARGPVEGAEEIAAPR
jgi:DNA-binding transcriptional MerR regulator